MGSKPPTSIQTIFRFIIEPFVCVLCDRGFDRLGHLTRHFLLCHNIEETFVCDICQIAFPEKSELNNHLLEHTDENPFECGICKKRFSRKILLNFHIREHFGNTPFVCEVCEARFDTKAKWNHHRNSHTVIFVCSRCKEITIEDDLKIHGMDHTEEKPLKCKACGKVFCDKDVSTNTILVRNCTTPSGEKPFKCNICEASFEAKLNLNKHLYDHAQEKLLRCDVCKVAYSDKESFVEHWRSRHGKISFQGRLSSQCSVENFCSACRKGLSEKSQLHARVLNKSLSCDVDQKQLFCQTEVPDHFSAHSDEKFFVCDDFQETKSLRHSSNPHIGCHGTRESISPEEERPIKAGTNELTGIPLEQKAFSCPFCKKEFTQQDEFSSHLQHHVSLEKKSFSCPLHKKITSKSDELNTNLREDVMVKQWQCNVCEKWFYHKKHLSKHRLSHKGKKSFVCNKCKKAFTYKKCLKSHLLKHDERSKKIFGGKNFKKYFIEKWLKCRSASHCKDKPFVCSQCHKAFSYPRGLSTHMLTHKIAKSFLCGICGKKFPQESHLIKHCRAAHNSEKDRKPSVV